MVEPIPYQLVSRASVFVFCVPSRDEVRLERREQEDGSVLWAILRNGDAWTKGRRWEYDRMPSSRTKAYLKRARWAFAEAWAECERIERERGFGLPPAEVLSRCLSALARSDKVTVEHRDGDVLCWVPTDDKPCAVRFSENVATWHEREARSAAIQAVEWCRALKIKVDLSGPAPVAKAA